jgi:hypothetical protein
MMKDHQHPITSLTQGKFLAPYYTLRLHHDMFFLVRLDNRGEKQNLKVKSRDNKWYNQMSPMAKEEHLKKQRIAHEQKNTALSLGQSENALL